MLIPTTVKIQRSRGYTFAVGRIRVLESRLLEASIFYQLADSRSIEEIESILGTSSYAKGVSTSSTASRLFIDFEEFLDREEIDSLNLIRDLSKDSRFIMPFFYKRDFHNLKLVVKSKVAHVENQWVKEGSVPVETVLGAIEEQNPSLLPEPFRTYGEEAQAMYEQKGRWQMIDVFLDNRLYEEIFKVTESLSFLEGLFRREVDMLNIRNFILCKRRNLNRGVFAPLLVKGGMLEEGLLGEMYEGGVDKLAEKLKFTPYALLSEDGIPYFKETGRFFKVEQNCDSLLLDYVSFAKYTAFGYEPLIRYLFLKINELKNLRIIFVGKQNGAYPEE
ncbi:MAG TPA: hypothetical protein EYP78_00290, partial [Candidatus Omnitrophica bacterium]|nr:hypothetical protein [Candidatus Omnitrophota bacterium]